MTSPSTILTALHALAGRAGEADLAAWLLDERLELEHAWSLGDQATLPFRAPPGPPFFYLTLARPFYPDRGLSGGTVVDHSSTGRRVSGLHGSAVGNDIVSFPFYPSDEATLTAQMMPLASDGGPLYPSLAAWEVALGRRLEQAEREWNAGALREALEADLLRNERIDLLARVNSLDNYLMAAKDIATAWLVERLTASLNGRRNEHKLIDTLWSSKALWDDTVGQSLTRIYHLVRQRDESPTSSTVAPVGDLGQEKAQLRDRLNANLAEMMDLLHRAGPVGSRAEAHVYEPLEGAPTRAQIENKYNTVEDLREHLEASEAALAGARRAFQDAHQRMPAGSVASVAEEEPPAVDSGVPLHDTMIVGWGDRVRDEDYPYGRGERTTAEWTVERSAQHGERICRTTLHPKSGRPGAPKCSTYGQRAKLGHGANGRVYGLIERRGGGSAEVILGTMDLDSYVRRSTDTARYDALMLAAFGDSTSQAPASKAPVDDAREKMMDTIWERTAKDMRAGSKKDRNREVTVRSPEGGASNFKLDQGSREDVVYVFRQKVGEAAESSPSVEDVVARLRNELDHLFEGYRWSVRALTAFGHNGVMISFYRAHPDAPAAEGLADRDQGSWGYENAPYIIRVAVEAAPGFKWKPGENAPARLKLRTVQLSGRDVWGGRPLEGVKPRAVTGPPDKVIEATSAWFSANADLLKGSGPGKPFPARLTNRGPSGPAPRALAQLAERAGLADLVEWLRTQAALLRVSGPLATLTPRRSRGVPGGSCEAPAPTCGATVEAHVRANPSIHEAVRELGRSLARPAVDALVARLEREGVKLEAPARQRLERAVETALANPITTRATWHTSALEGAGVLASTRHR